MPKDDNSPTYSASFTNASTASDTSACCDNSITTNSNIVSDLYEVIKLNPILYHCIIQATAING